MYQMPEYLSVIIAFFFIGCCFACAFEIYDTLLRIKINKNRLASRTRRKE